MQASVRQPPVDPEPAGRAVTISVLVPTYRRPYDLRRCLTALAAQARLPDEVVVVLRDDDADSQALLASMQPYPCPLRLVTLSAPGVVAALNAGLAAIANEIIAITDDDAAPRPDWVQRIASHYVGGLRVAGVGGRDWLHGVPPESVRSRVGQLQWWGRVIGNHHLGVGPARDVDVLKGANMSLRRAAVAGRGFCTRLRGSGAQVHWELECSLALRRAGWRLIYDPMVAVDHYLAPRFDYDQRDQFNALALRDAVHNETLALLEHLSPWRRTAFVCWAVLVGTIAAPGFVQWVRFHLIGVDHAGSRLTASLRGRWDGWRTWREGRRALPSQADVQPAGSAG